MRVILGMQEAHDASVAIMIDGKIVAAAQEERFSGLKGDYGYPQKAIQACLNTAGITPDQIDQVVLSSHNWNPVLTKIKRNANFSVSDWVREQREYWKPLLFEGKKVRYYDLFKDNSGFRYDDTYPMEHLLDGYMDAHEMDEMKQLRKETVSRLLGVDIDRITTVTHEDCHTFYSYFGSHFREEALALTAEGIGDYSNGTVSRFSEKGREELAATRENHIGHIYQYMTLILGMKPSQHEYKLMGMAPYANVKELEKSYTVFENVLKVDGLNIVYDEKPSDLYYHFREALEGHRFDGMAGAVQLFTEKLLSQWVKNCVEATGISRIVFSGGVAQNIKANKSLMELDEVQDFCVCPAAGDASLPLGACYYAMWKHLSENGESLDVLKPLEHMYLGPTFDNDAVEEVIQKQGVESRYTITRGVQPADVAKRLAEGSVIARCSGPMEFGLRALGNRSIMADPRNPEMLPKINRAIKFRDFWMPFTPSILQEREADYIVNPKGIQSPFMTMAFDSTPLARKDLSAALHPADQTVRPQILKKSHNPEYYAIIKEFEKITGVGGILNTSFNLHGDPIVLGPEAAIRTMDNSGLDGLLMNDVLIERNG